MKEIQVYTKRKCSYGKNSLKMDQIDFGGCGISTTGGFKGQITQIFVKIIT